MIEFYKVGLKQYEESMYEFASNHGLSQSWVKYNYDNLKVPARATKRSGAYDFYAPFSFRLEVGQRLLVPTGIGFRSDDPAIQMLILPRSGLGNRGLHIANVIPLIDNDYCEATNGGHIMLCMQNMTSKSAAISIDQHQAFAQGLFIKTYTTIDDDASTDRVGGFGSTDKTNN